MDGSKSCQRLRQHQIPTDAGAVRRVPRNDPGDHWLAILDTKLGRAQRKHVPNPFAQMRTDLLRLPRNFRQTKENCIDDGMACVPSEQVR